MKKLLILIFLINTSVSYGKSIGDTSMDFFSDNTASVVFMGLLPIAESVFTGKANMLISGYDPLKLKYALDEFKFYTKKIKEVEKLKSLLKLYKGVSTKTDKNLLQIERTVSLILEKEYFIDEYEIKRGISRRVLDTSESASNVFAFQKAQNKVKLENHVSRLKRALVNSRLALMYRFALYFSTFELGISYLNELKNEGFIDEDSIWVNQGLYEYVFDIRANTALEGEGSLNEELQL